MASASGSFKVKTNTKNWQALRKRVEEIGKKSLKVGVLASKGGNEAVEGSDITMIELAAIHEFGAPRANIPERSFIRLTFAGKDKEIEEMVGKAAKALLAGKMDVDRALNILGMYISGEVKKAITTGPSIPPPLKQATIDRKGSSRALVDTGRLVNSISWEVVDKE